MTDGFELIDGETVEPAESAPDDPVEGPNSRRRLFKMGAVGVAAVGAAAVGNTMGSGQAGAATGGDLIIGGLNSVTSETDVTALEGGELWVINNDATLPAIKGVNSGGVGVMGVSQSGVIGVQGQSLLATPGSIGVEGTGVVGVQGVTNGAGTASTQGPGVLGVGNSTGVGVQAQNASGASLRLEPFGTTTLPAASVPGQFIVLSDGSLHYSYVGNTWKPMTSTVQIEPVRVIDTASGLGGITGPLAPGDDGAHIECHRRGRRNSPRGNRHRRQLRYLGGGRGVAQRIRGGHHISGGGGHSGHRQHQCRCRVLRHLQCGIGGARDRWEPGQGLDRLGRRRPGPPRAGVPRRHRLHPVGTPGGSRTLQGFSYPVRWRTKSSSLQVVMGNRLSTLRSVASW